MDLTYMSYNTTENTVCINFEQSCSSDSVECSNITPTLTNDHLNKVLKYPTIIF